MECEMKTLSYGLEDTTGYVLVSKHTIHENFNTYEGTVLRPT